MGAIAGGLTSMIGGISADQQARGGENASENLMNQALARLLDIDTPDIDLLKRDYLVPELVGEFTPEMERALSLDPSAMEDVAVDPRLAQAQYDALQQLAGLADTGLSNADIAMLEQTRRGAAAQDQARQNAIMQEMRQRGIGGSGAELAARLKSSQNAADRASQEGMQIAQMAQQRALQALMNQGNLASSMRNQDVGEQSNVARAKDAINQFNVSNRQNVGQRNVGMQNQAQMQNLANRQAIENQRAAIRNAQQDVNRELYQRDFDNKLRKEAPITGQSNTLAGETRSNAQAQGERTKDIFDSFGNMFGGMGFM